MKKCLVALCMACAVCTLSAQNVADFASLNKNAMVKTTVQSDIKEKARVSVQKQAPYSAELMKFNDETQTEHTVSPLYRCPIGSLYSTLSPDWMGRSVTYLYTPALMDLEWQNYCRIDGKLASKDNLGWTIVMSEDPVDIDSHMNEDGDLLMHRFGFTHTPTVHVFAPEDAEHAEELDSYTLARSEEAPEESYLVAGMDTLEYLGNASILAGLYSGFSDGGEFTSNANFYTLEKDEITGRVNFKDTGKKCVGFAEYYEAPSDLLYVTSVYMNCFTDDEVQEGQILEGKTLTLKLYRVSEDGEMEIYATANADEDDVYMSDNQSSSFTFRFVEDDPIFGEMEAPVLLDSTSDYLLEITGFEQLTTSWTCVFSPADGFTGHGYAVLEDGKFATIGYSNALTTPQIDLYISFEAIMPVAQVTESFTDVTVMIPAEGGYGLTIYDEEEQDWYLDFDIYTLNSSEWWEEVDVPDWVEIEYDDEYTDYGVMCVYLSADELPAGMDGRYGEVILSLYGKEVVIPVAQGELPSSVKTKTVKSSKPVYFNINGQQEMNPAKGKVYITDGQKVVF